MEKIVLAADLGGTNLRMAAVAPDGRVLHRERRATPRSENGGDVVDAIEAAARSSLAAVGDSGKTAALAVAAAATIDPVRGLLTKAPNMPAVNGLALRDELSGRLGFPVYLENDATSAAVGENWLGASRGVSNSVCVTLGTGVGGGLIIDGRPLRGIDGTAGEIGHICVEPFGAPCGCGSIGCLEQYASATALVRIAGERAEHFPESVLSGRGEMTSVDIYKAAQSSDPLALEVFRTMGLYLGIALAGLVNVLNPEVIVIGGGGAGSWDQFIGHVRAEIDKRAFREPAERVKLVAAELGDDAGILGAARLAFMAGV